MHGQRSRLLSACGHRAPFFHCENVVCVALQGARNERRLVAVCCSNSSTFEIIHGLLNRVMEVLGVPVRLPGQGALLC